VTGSCEYRNEPSGSVKFLEISRAAERLLASQEGFGFMELVVFIGK
jgi:hypothetical protein